MWTTLNWHVIVSRGCRETGKECLGFRNTQGIYWQTELLVAFTAWIVYKIKINWMYWFLISSFRRVQNVVCFLLGDSPASDTPFLTIPSSHPLPSCKQNLSSHQPCLTPGKNTAEQTRTGQNIARSSGYTPTLSQGTLQPRLDPDRPTNV